MRFVVAILGVVVVLGLLGGMKAAQISALIGSGKKAAQAGPPPEVVATATVGEATWESTISDVGSVTASKGVTLSTEASGIVTKILFESGQEVKAGAPILELEASVERSQLAAAVARRELAATTLQRTEALVKSGSIAKAQLDADRAQMETADKDAAALRAQIGRKTVRAPFDGRVGIREVHLGQYLAAGTPIAGLENPKALFVDFTTPQQRLPDLAVDRPVRIELASDGGTPREGAITAIEPSVDPVTRTVRVRASVPNQDEGLRPGMFVRVTVVLPEARRTVIAPATAIVHASYGDSVFVVEAAPDGKRVARQRFVRTGAARGDFVTIQEGLEPGVEVVTAGAFKLRNGAPIVVNQALSPKPEVAPRPQNR